MAVKTSFKKILALSSTVSFTRAWMTAGLALNPKKPEDPSSNTSYSRRSLVTTKCLQAAVNSVAHCFCGKSLEFHGNPSYFLLFLSL